MILRGMLQLTALAGLSIAAFCQMASRTAPIPADPLEMVTGPIRILDTPESRQPALQLIARARQNESLKAAGRGYDLKVSFTVTAGAQTDYDGGWQMEEIYIPHQGTRWTAKSSAGYSTTQITVDDHSYGDGPGNTIPLRLHEARSALFGAVSTNAGADAMRASAATYRGVAVTCFLFAPSSISLTVTPARRWDETEECIDPQTGLIQVHSQVPGRYSGYDYTDGPKLGDRILPRQVTVTEGGRTVSLIHVDSLTELSEADPNLFIPSAEMKARGESIAMTGAVKHPVFPERGTVPPDAAIQPVCVFALVTPSGQVVEAHSLQPSDPNSPAAVEFARSMSFDPGPASARPSQHFVFFIEKFTSPNSPNRAPR